MPLLLQLLFRRCSSAESVHRAGLEERSCCFSALAFDLDLPPLLFRSSAFAFDLAVAVDGGVPRTATADHWENLNSPRSLPELHQPE